MNANSREYLFPHQWSIIASAEIDTIVLVIIQDSWTDLCHFHLWLITNPWNNSLNIARRSVPVCNIIVSLVSIIDILCLHEVSIGSTNGPSTIAFHRICLKWDGWLMWIRIVSNLRIIRTGESEVLSFSQYDRPSTFCWTIRIRIMNWIMKDVISPSATVALNPLLLVVDWVVTVTWR